MKILVNVNIRKTQIHNAFFLNIKFALIITSTYVLIDNFCPCFVNTLLLIKVKEQKIYLTEELDKVIRLSFILFKRLTKMNKTFEMYVGINIEYKKIT